MPTDAITFQKLSMMLVLKAVYLFFALLNSKKKKKASLERGRNSQGGKQMKMEPDAFSQELGFSTPLGLHRLLALSLFAPWSE